ncbi:MAG: 16S rRNA (cytidine(1402)-2'-O)-methyltransferase [Halarsenatibacteraceae bacterium]
MSGKLYICPTPIGNLEDITYRTIRILKEVDLIACEDTRRTGRLLKHFEIDNDLISYHEHNEKMRTEEIIDKLKMNQDIALVSDAGMPGLSDPGEILIKAVVNQGIEVIPLPGPSAAVPALVASGFATDRFVFEGFLPRKGQERKDRFASVKLDLRTTIIYESPYRTKDTINDLARLMPDREIALIREISKMHEEKIYGTAADIRERIADREIKGEVVIVISGNQTLTEEEKLTDLSILEHLELLIENGYTKKKAIKEVAKIRELPKSKVYKEAIAIDARPEFRE